MPLTSVRYRSPHLLTQPHAVLFCCVPSRVAGWDKLYIVVCYDRELQLETQMRAWVDAIFMLTVLKSLHEQR